MIVALRQIKLMRGIQRLARQRSGAHLSNGRGFKALDEGDGGVDFGRSAMPLHPAEKHGERRVADLGGMDFPGYPPDQCGEIFPSLQSAGGEKPMPVRNPPHPQSKLLHEMPQRRVAFMHKFRAELHGRFPSANAARKNASAEPFPGLEQRHFRFVPREKGGGGESRDAAADDDGFRICPRHAT